MLGFLKKSLADADKQINAELMKLTPEQRKELQPYLDKVKNTNTKDTSSPMTAISELINIANNGNFNK